MDVCRMNILMTSYTIVVHISKILTTGVQFLSFIERGHKMYCWPVTIYQYYQTPGQTPSWWLSVKGYLSVLSGQPILVSLISTVAVLRGILLVVGAADQLCYRCKMYLRSVFIIRPWCYNGEESIEPSNCKHFALKRFLCQKEGCIYWSDHYILIMEFASCTHQIIVAAKNYQFLVDWNPFHFLANRL